MKHDAPISLIMSRDPIAIHLGQKVSDVRDVLSSERFHHLPVVSGRKLVGMISSTDLMRFGFSMFEGDEDATFAALDEQFNLEDLMETHLITVTTAATVRDTAKALSTGGFHSIPVVDENDHLVGIVTTTDLINYLLEE